MSSYHEKVTGMEKSNSIWSFYIEKIEKLFVLHE
jgi:hypothetical protein